MIFELRSRFKLSQQSHTAKQQVHKCKTVMAQVLCYAGRINQK